ncbi:MAG: hypothetical protein LBM98_11710 [Oscillospiraceae bacterium]|nr:hypothetical protein [Oscillospiraceae bacterium]
MRYVGRYRCEAIQCRGENIRICGLRHWIAAPVSILRIASVPRLAKTGRALPCPRALRGESPRRLRRHPSQEGNLDVGYAAHDAGRAGLKPAPT